MSEPSIVRIDWLDVQSVDMGMFTLKDLEEIEPLKASIVGFLVKETPAEYFIAKEYWEQGYFKYLHIIPKSQAIVSFKVISRGKKDGDK